MRLMHIATSTLAPARMSHRNRLRVPGARDGAGGLGAAFSKLKGWSDCMVGLDQPYGHEHWLQRGTADERYSVRLARVRTCFCLNMVKRVRTERPAAKL